MLFATKTADEIAIICLLRHEGTT